jgi:hypothetical protein
MHVEGLIGKKTYIRAVSAGEEKEVRTISF